MAREDQKIGFSVPLISDRRANHDCTPYQNVASKIRSESEALTLGGS